MSVVPFGASVRFVKIAQIAQPRCGFQPAARQCGGRSVARSKLGNNFVEKQKIKALVLDIDGVLTDGRLYFTDNGEAMKAFYVHDGTAIKNWQEKGLRIAFLSGRESSIVNARARDLGVEKVLQGVREKLQAFEQLAADWSLTHDQICYVGDDLPDLPPMRACGFPVAVANAVPVVKNAAKYITSASGGAGAVREVVDYLLNQGDKT